MEAGQAISALGALAQETRLAAFRVLVQQGASGLAAGILADRVGVPASSLSFHLTHLTRAGLLTQRRQSRLMIYSVNFEAMNALLTYLAENCCGQGISTVPICNPAARPEANAQDGSAPKPARCRTR